MTANEIAPIARLLRSRLEVIAVRGPTSAEVGFVIDGMIGDIVGQMELGGMASELTLPLGMRRAIATEFEAGDRFGSCNAAQNSL